MNFLVGTSGYSYKEWKGYFYPDDIAAQDMLRFYAGHLPAVEINNTFYRLPRASMLEGWTSQVPENFRFVLKASQRITHFKRLRNADDETEYLVETAGTLGPRLGALLFQLPPNFKVDAARLDDFLDILPKGTRAAFEFRHASWATDDIFALLRARDCAWCVSDTEESGDTDVVSTADWGYLRLRRPEYSKTELSGWVDAIRDQGWHTAYVFFKHEDEGSGPKLAAEFLKIAGR